MVNRALIDDHYGRLRHDASRQFLYLPGLQTEKPKRSARKPFINSPIIWPTTAADVRPDCHWDGISMEGYDTTLLVSFFTFPGFKQKYGAPDPSRPGNFHQYRPAIAEAVCEEAVHKQPDNLAYHSCRRQARFSLPSRASNRNTEPRIHLVLETLKFHPSGNRA
jgi:hypothetical protein